MKVDNNFNLGLIEAYVGNLDWKVKENANMSYSLQGLNQYLSSNLTEKYWLENIYTEDIKNAHNSGDIHIHDLGILGVYCVGWDLYDLLHVGFRGVRGKIYSRPAKHFRSALGQVVNFLYTLQGEAAGAQAISNFDTLLAPFIRYDNLNYEQVKQALQEFVYNLNVPTRVGFQTPFTNISLDLKVPNNLKNNAVIIGGVPKDVSYGEFQSEMDILNKAFAEVLSEGDAHGRVFTFPIPTYNITKDFDFETSNYDYIWEMTAKYGIPYFSNFVNSDLNPDDVRSMCCRLRLDNRELKFRGGGLFGANPLTGSIGVVTINLSRIGYISKDRLEFFSNLKNLMDLSKDSLEKKRYVLENLMDMGLYPYSKFYLRNIKSSTGKYWVNHFSTIGLIGMNEASINLIGKDIGTKEGLEFAESVLDFMRDVLLDYQKETQNIYNLEATPAEGASYRLAKLDVKEYPNIRVANQNSSKPFYTNSTHLPVDYTNDIFFALDQQDSLQTKYTGGTVMHIFLGEKKPSINAVKKFVKRVAYNYHLPYFTLTPSFSICDSHGYIFGEHISCPKCADEGKINSCEIYSRIVGYLRPVDQWNDGKKMEFNLREKYDKGLNYNLYFASGDKV